MVLVYIVKYIQIFHSKTTVVSFHSEWPLKSQLMRTFWGLII